MVTLWATAAFLVAGAELKTCRDGAVIRASERCAELSDHRTQFAVAPATATQTVEWACMGRTAMTKVRIVELPYAKELGEPLRNHRFRVELVDLQVGGRPASRPVVARLRAILAPLNGLSQLHGRCFRNVPAVSLVGTVLGEDARQPRRAEIELSDWSRDRKTNAPTRSSRR